MQKIFKSLYRSLFVMIVVHDGVEHAGFMSFMVLLSLFPFLVFFFAFTGFFGESQLGRELVAFLIDNLPANAIASIKTRIIEIVETPPPSLMNLAIIGTIWTSSSFVEGLRTILNRIYHISSPPPYLWRRFLSIILFLVITILLYISTIMLIIVPTALMEIPSVVGIVNSFSPIWGYIHYFLIFITMLFIVAALYYILPNAKITFIEVLPGAVVTVILWLFSGYLLTKYLVYYTQLNIVYGSIASIIITLIFFFIINFLFIYGAAFNYEYMRKNNGEAAC